MEEKEEKTAEIKAAAPEETDKFGEYDKQVFRSKYPQVDPDELEKNEAFRRFCGSRYGKLPLVRLYEDYLALLQEAENKVREKDRQTDRSERSTGCGGSSGAETLTASEQKALDAWNHAFPRMKMSAKEFLERKG